MKPLLREPDLAVAKGAALISFKKFAEKVVEETGGSTDEIEKKAKKAGIYLPGDELAAKGIIINLSSKAFGLVMTRLDENKKVQEYVYHVIDRHSRLPTEKAVTGFRTLYDNQTEMRFKLMEQADGNTEHSEDLEDNILLSEGRLTGLPPNLPADSPIHITFRLDVDGRLTIHAVEPSSSKECVIDAKVTGVISEEEVIKSKDALLGLKVS